MPTVELFEQGWGYEGWLFTGPYAEHLLMVNTRKDVAARAVARVREELAAAWGEGRPYTIEMAVSAAHRELTDWLRQVCN